jgi:hypothetical protein
MSLDKKKMKCNVPRRDVQGGKKFVVKACEGGKEKIIRFGDANMKIKKNIPARIYQLVRKATVLAVPASKVKERCPLTIGQGELGIAKWQDTIHILASMTEC